MADDADDFDGNIFIYRGGQQVVPQHVTHVRIDKSVDEIEDNAFLDRVHLVQVDSHDGLRKIGKWAFRGCKSLRQINNLESVVEIDDFAFYLCGNLESAEFGDRLETIGNNAFGFFTSLKHAKLPSTITIGAGAFTNCTRLADIELSERLETIEASAFSSCDRLQRIAIPLKRDLFPFDEFWRKYSQFDSCYRLTTVDLVGIGGIDKTIASLHMESWRAEMISEINLINQVLPTKPANEKTEEIRRWMESVIDKMDHYKAEHFRYLKEGTTLLELALWKVKLAENEDNCEEGKRKKAKVDADSYQRDKRITCGADTVIKNVLPFLRLE